MKKYFLGLFCLLIIASSLFVGVNKVSANDVVTATVVDKPTLKLTYDNSGLSSRNESLLKATFNVRIKAGSTNYKIYIDTANLIFVNNTGNVGIFKNDGSQVINSKITTISNLSSLKEYVDQYGKKYVIIPANKTALFKVVSTVNPSQLFAGSYTSSLVNLFNFTDDYQVIPVSRRNNKTNSVTIVGEKSPYITSVTADITNTDLSIVDIHIAGARLNGGTIDLDESIYIDGNKIAAFNNGDVEQSIDGTSISFSISKLSAGYHTLYIINSTGPNAGASNKVNFMVSSTTKPPISTGPSITVLSPNGGEQISIGKKDTNFKTTWISNNLKGDIDIYLKSPDNSRTCLLQKNVLISKGSYTEKISTKYKCPNLDRYLTAGQYKVLLNTDLKGVSDESDEYFTITSDTLVKPCSYIYGNWSSCVNGKQIRPYKTSYNCVGVPEISRSCNQLNLNSLKTTASALESMKIEDIIELLKFLK